MEPRVIALFFLVVTSLLASCAASPPPVVSPDNLEGVAEPPRAYAPDDYKACTPGEPLAESSVETPYLTTSPEGMDLRVTIHCREVITAQGVNTNAESPKSCLVCDDAEMECIGGDDDHDLIRMTGSRGEVAFSRPRACPKGTLFFQHQDQTYVNRQCHNQLHAEEFRVEHERSLVQRLLDEYDERQAAQSGDK